MQILNYLDLALTLHRDDEPLPEGLHEILMSGEIPYEAAKEVSVNKHLTGEQQDALLNLRDDYVTPRVMLYSDRSFIGAPVKHIAACLSIDPEVGLARAIEAFQANPRGTLEHALVGTESVRDSYTLAQVKQMLNLATIPNGPDDPLRGSVKVLRDGYRALVQTLSYRDAHEFAWDESTSLNALTYLLPLPFSPRNALRIASRILNTSDRFTSRDLASLVETSVDGRDRTCRVAFVKSVRQLSAGDVPADIAPYVLNVSSSDAVIIWSKSSKTHWAATHSGDVEEIADFVDILERAVRVLDGSRALLSAWTQRMLHQLHTRPDVPTSVRRKGFKWLDHNYWTAPGQRPSVLALRESHFLGETNPFDLFEENSYELEYWRKNFPAHLLQVVGWDGFGEHSKLVPYLPTDASQYSAQGTYSQIILEQVPPAREILKHLKVSFLPNMLRSAHAPWIRLASEMLDEATTDNPEARHVVTTLLSSGWEGTYGELLATARAVTH